MPTHITAVLWLNDTLGKRHLLIVGRNYCNVDAVDYGRQSDAKVAGGSGMVKGFPTVWAQNIKDVKLVQVGGSYSAIIDIGHGHDVYIGTN